MRGTPAVVQLLIITLFDFGTKRMVVAIIGFGLNSAAYVSEVMRSVLCPSIKDSLKRDEALV